MAIAKTFSDSIQATDSIQAELTLGAYASDTIEITDQITVRLIQGATDSIEVADQLKAEVWYDRKVSDAVESEDRLLEGDPVLVVHSIDGGVTAGPADVHTVSPEGPLSISGGNGCEDESPPIGFVVRLGDTIEVTDLLQVDLKKNDITINDAIQISDIILVGLLVGGEVVTFGGVPVTFGGIPVTFAPGGVTYEAMIIDTMEVSDA